MSLIAIIVAALRAIPALRQLFVQISDELQRQNEAEAINRKAAKDAEVDTAIDAALRVRPSATQQQSSADKPS